MFRDVQASDVEQVEFTGSYTWLDADPGPGEDLQPNVVRDPRKIQAIIDAFRASTHLRSVEPTTDPPGPPERLVFRYRKGLGREDLYIRINDNSVLQDYGPSVQRMILGYRQRSKI